MVPLRWNRKSYTTQDSLVLSHLEFAFEEHPITVLMIVSHFLEDDIQRRHTTPFPTRTKSELHRRSFSSRSHTRHVDANSLDAVRVDDLTSTNAIHCVSDES